jgi:hypothetical protein
MQPEHLYAITFFHTLHTYIQTKSKPQLLLKHSSHYHILIFQLILHNFCNRQDEEKRVYSMHLLCGDQCRDLFIYKKLRCWFLRYYSVEQSILRLFYGLCFNCAVYIQCDRRQFLPYRWDVCTWLQGMGGWQQRPFHGMNLFWEGFTRV